MYSRGKLDPTKEIRLLKTLSTLISHWLLARRYDPLYTGSNLHAIRYELRPGDLVLVEGQTRVARIIQRLTLSSWSHVMLYLGRVHDVEDRHIRHRVQSFCNASPEDMLILESEMGRGTVVQTLDHYSDYHLRILRPKNIRYQDVQTVIAFCVDRLGKEYNLRQIVDLMRYLLPWKVLPRRWGSSLFRYQPNSPTTVCSTLLAEAYAAVDFPVLPLIKDDSDGQYRLFQRNPMFVYPATFDKSPYFDVIKTAHVDHGPVRGAYKLMPWRGHLQLDEPEQDYYIQDHDHDDKA
ncbi:hypothetical protein GH975_04375 [Litorivicinus lipolyticus]|uniref:Permuted papain-like amidase enzyme, YaeF/YiiX, C92 family n=1 Tax=Litorivicinus lipolyticus TaxID=418701 RepID=A0A5Q2QDC7_9GAMM|nr:hypothetical protein GH975_04375 [Litorivicinus lipolyticus]